MKIILYSTISVNGMIARADGREDFLSDDNCSSFSDLAQECGCIVMGRKTYEAVEKWDEDYSFDTIVGIDRVVISRDENFKVREGFIIATSPIDAVAMLKALGHDKMLVPGGATNNALLWMKTLLTKLYLTWNPLPWAQAFLYLQLVNLHINLSCYIARKLKMEFCNCITR